MISKGEWKTIRGSNKEPDHIMLSINGNSETSMTVTWRTNADIEKGFVLFRQAGTSEWKRKEAQTESFETDVDLSNYFWANIEGLSPDTRYEYTCGNEEFRSKAFSFKTSPENLTDFKFVILADTQTGSPTPPPDYTLLGDLIRNVILKKHPDIAFILTAGDNTNCGQTDVQWTGFMAGLKGIIESIPLMMCLGNHDDMGFADYYEGTGKYYSDKATYFCSQFKGSYPYNGPKDWKTATYSFDFGNAHFAILGTSGYEDVNKWLIKDADFSDKTWKFGVHHFPVCFAGSDLECVDTYPALKEGMEKLDVIFSGHEHCFSRSFPRRDDNLYDKPSQGTVHYNCGSSHRNPPGTRSLEKCWNAALYNHEQDLSMYAVAHVNGDALMLTSFIEDGRIADECIIDKNTDTITPAALAPIYNKTRMKYKGADLGLCASSTFCHLLNGIWFIPAAVLVQYIGGQVERQKGSITLSVYGRTAKYFENSDKAQTDRGGLKLCAPVTRMDRGQLYVPVDDLCKSLGMTWRYFSRNNFISIEHESEEKPVPEQPKMKMINIDNKAARYHKDGIPRCKWARGVPDIYREYHDSEWGVPVYDDKKLFEMLLLESFQAGLSWITILNKREDFRRAFDGFDYKLIARYDENKINELMQDKSIIRNHGKITAAVKNAGIFMGIQEEFGSFCEYIRGFTKGKIIKNEDECPKTRSELSDAISKDLRGRGMSFVGTTIIYSYLQAIGVIDDHEKGCFKY
ncbi:MAG: DNA-3-methyladenine glycosylase 1 [Firmicutes bacterium ADurb.Bin300]|nr:MAG: DNA-3-methyladenine glycosylase 1 [Firmicutes bacterium ADurb.Bin300]